MGEHFNDEAEHSIPHSHCFLLPFIRFHHSINVRNADNTYKLATDYGAQQKSGSYHFGGSGGRRSTEELELFWKMLEKHTDCTYSDIETQG